MGTTEASNVLNQVTAVASTIKSPNSLYGMILALSKRNSSSDRDYHNRPDYSMPQPIVTTTANKEIEEFRAQLSYFRKELEGFQESNEKLGDILLNNIADCGTESTPQANPS